MFKYFRAMSVEEFNSFDSNEEIRSGFSSSTYWTDSRDVARRYQTEGRVIAEISVDREMPSTRKGIALHSEGNHREWVMPVEEFNDFVGKHMWDLKQV